MNHLYVILTHFFLLILFDLKFKKDNEITILQFTETTEEKKENLFFEHLLFSLVLNCF
jgi:uncharacterized membrane-anchored protein YitT (DUF2179 family)